MACEYILHHKCTPPQTPEVLHSTEVIGNQRIISKAYKLVSVEALVVATNDGCAIRVKLTARLSE